MSRIVVLVLLLSFVSTAVAGNNRNFGYGNQVGGVSISAEGAIGKVDPLALKETNDVFQELLQGPSAKLKKPVELRKISLKAIEETLSTLGQAPISSLPEEIKYMAGIQRLQYVLLYPETNDIVLAGPGEGWKLDGKGSMVGVTTGRPVLYLEDLLIAFRTVEAARRGQLSCSIDPTAEGRQRYEQLMSTQKTFTPAIVGAIEKAFGDQQITISGAPETSHFACVLVAADYKMKRIGMKLEASPVKGLSSFIDMAPARLDNMMPRWWMACNYEPMGRSEDGLAWELRGQGVKVQTEDEFVNNAEGTVRGSGKASPAAQKWSDQFTAKYDELAVHEPVFGDLRNLMDMCVIAALFSKENLAAKAKCDLPQLTSAKGSTSLDKWNAPKKVATQSSATKKGSNWVITASGGVSINSWEAADKSVVQPAVAVTRDKAKAVAGAGEGLWWN
ncbi:DUF1598 domain-containing protein [Anatilimnocola floriformis]|uniref:DUF1598 domain-containing protein n=1 Tax=Anatilimnocola floriformis TaxID=2948575 RepID=UPI0020C25F77|nr:DUF1598 domain-containing protein [Anatilimnocola floriformis]